MKSTLELCKRIEPLSLVFLLALVGVIFRFWPWMPEVFFGDDLSNFLAYKDGNFPVGLEQTFSFAFAEKYRPIFVWVISFMFGTFQEHIAAYLAVNILLHGLNATFVFALAHRLSNGNWIVSLIVALAVATSRFATYQVTQVTGLLEGIALMFFLVMTYCMVRANDAAKEIACRWCWAAVVAALLIIHTHERYIVVAVWLSLTIILLPNIRRIGQNQRFMLLGSCVAMLLLNLIIKTTILEIPFFVGTGGTRVDIDALRILDHLRQAFLSIYGFNEGPEYLVGVRIGSLGAVWLLALTFALVWLMSIVSGMRSALETNTQSASSASSWRPLALPLLLVALGTFVLIPAVLTIRLEQRWLLEPFIILLLLFAWAAGILSAKKQTLVWILAVLIGLCSMAVDSFIAPHFRQIFFISSAQFAKAAKREIAEQEYSGSSPIVLIASSDHCNWTLLQGDFFRLYGASSRKMLCFGSIGEAISSTQIEGARIYNFDSNSLHLREITLELLDLARSRGQRVTYDFLESFSEGRISSLAKVDSPNGKGVILMSWDSLLDLRKTLTVVTGFSYRYDAVAIERNTYVRFGVAMVYPSQESARVSLIVEEKGSEPRTLYSDNLTPPRPGERLKFDSISISLKDFINKSISISFIVETSLGKDSSGHWVAFSEPRIVSDATPKSFVKNKHSNIK